MDFGLDRNWWVLALRGVLAILFGLMAFFWPGFVLVVVAFIFGAYALIDGCMAIVLAVSGHGQGARWWALLLEGVVGIAAGVIAFLSPLIADLALLYVIAAWLLVTGVFEIVAAITLRKYIEGEWALALSGALSVILGVLLALQPREGLIAVAWWIGAYSIAFGILFLVVAFRLRTWGRARTPRGAVAP
jgi:uncharacterized membrane protein HdeD (DUF308 family)